MTAGGSGMAAGAWAMASGGSDKAGAAASPFSLSSRADNCRASSLKALFSTGVSIGDFDSPIGRNGSTFFCVSSSVSASTGLSGSSGGSTAVSKSVWCEVSKAIGADGSGMLDDATLDGAGGASVGKSSTNRSSVKSSADKSSDDRSSDDGSSANKSSAEESSAGDSATGNCSGGAAGAV